MGLFNKLFPGNSEQETTVAAEMRRNRFFRLRDVIVFLLIIGFFLLARNSLGLGNFGGLTPVLEETRFGITDLNGETHFFTYRDAESIELRDDLKNFDQGEMVDGKENRQVLSGTFRNSEFGEYQLHIEKKLNNYIVVHDANGVLVFNIESDETTKILYENLMEQRAKQQA